MRKGDTVVHVAKNRKLFFLIMMFSVINSYGQNRNQEAIFRLGDSAFTKLLSAELLNQWKSEKDKTCVQSVTYAQFTIDEKGNVADVKFYRVRNTPEVIERIISSSLHATDGKWQPKLVEGKPIKSSIFLLPIKYDLEAGCDNNVLRLTEGKPEGLTKFLTDIEHTENVIILKPIVIFSHI